MTQAAAAAAASPHVSTVDAEHDREVPEIDLLSPLTMRAARFRNRIVMSPMCQYAGVAGAVWVRGEAKGEVAPPARAAHFGAVVGCVTGRSLAFCTSGHSTSTRQALSDSSSHCFSCRGASL